MATSYTLTLPQGVITENRGQFVGSETHGIWSPVNPKALGGWKDGDTLTVVCTFNLNPENTADLPPASSYFGLSAAAINNASSTAGETAINQAKTWLASQRAGIVGAGITTGSASSSFLFYNASSETENIPLVPTTRGTITDIVYEWNMTYNANYPNVTVKDIEIIFGYGDPMWDEENA